MQRAQHGPKLKDKSVFLMDDWDQPCRMGEGDSGDQRQSRSANFSSMLWIDILGSLIDDYG
jgi:hypothetical protein